MLSIDVLCPPSASSLVLPGWTLIESKTGRCSQLCTGSFRTFCNNISTRKELRAYISYSYLGRRGCWATAFNFAKLLFSLDPEVRGHSFNTPPLR